MHNTSFFEETQKWRDEREANLKKPDSWLAVSGLFWLKDGSNTLGSDPASDVPLPTSVPAQVGVIIFSEGVAELRVNAGVDVTCDGAAVTHKILQSDASGHPDKIKIGDSVQLMLLKRGNRFGLRMWDANSEALREFHGLKWYAPKEEYRVTARFAPTNPPRKLLIDTVLEGFQEEAISPGVLEFELGGKTHRLAAESADASKGLFINFRDQTSGKATYGAGRFLQTSGVKDGLVMLDFNRAYTPPCGFTNFATCPIPLRENWLDIAIEAGELKPH